MFTATATLQHRWRDAGASTGHVIKTRHHTMRITITPPSHQHTNQITVAEVHHFTLHPFTPPCISLRQQHYQQKRSKHAKRPCSAFRKQGRHLARKRHLPSVLKQASPDSPKHTTHHAPRMCTHTKVSTAYHAAPRAPCTPTNHQ